ncbi:hypothetical protein [Halocatena salina]|uniref:Uncharacterized protein n=1 Tax=Halocatena salina TaxID=2934340 RepID=A0A8U0A6E2_9EURY|nr:hypothetical protein [Halocatena salina]UPM44594.1 hypothetical protein MW046_16215 [Halocatena salina]
MMDEPLAHMVTVDATGLQEVPPVTRESDDFTTTPTALEITRATPATPLYVRVTAQLEPASDAGDGAVRIALSDPSGDSIQYSDSATVEEGTGIRTTGWSKVPADCNGGTARLCVSNARVTAITLELAIRNDV